MMGGMSWIEPELPADEVHVPPEIELRRLLDGPPDNRARRFLVGFDIPCPAGDAVEVDRRCRMVLSAVLSRQLGDDPDGWLSADGAAVTAGQQSSDVAITAGRRTSEAAITAGRVTTDAAIVAGRLARESAEALAHNVRVQQALNSRTGQQAQALGEAGVDRARQLGGQAAHQARRLGGRAQQMWKERQARRVPEKELPQLPEKPDAPMPE
jgi:hypothetical protein